MADALGMTQARLSRIETSRAIPTADDMTALLDLYGVRGERRTELLALADAERGPIRDQRLVVQRGRTAAMQARWLRMQSESQLIRAFHPALVLGPLQTSRYASVIVPGDPAWLESRLAQGVGRTTTRHVLIQTEGALRCTAGSADVMAGQLDHLIDVSRLPHVDLGVIPAARQMAPCPTGFHLYEGAGFTYAVLGLEVATATLDQPEDIAFFSTLFDRLAALAVYGDELRELLERIGADFRSGGTS